jgi:cystathionine beta-lyase/cystathionine gamma-synthase
MAAETTLLLLFGAGDHIIAHSDLYGGTYRLLTTVMADKNIAVDFVDLRDPEAICQALKPQTKAIWAESPTNPCMRLVDLEMVAAIAKERALISICDNTFSSPYFQRPLERGIDVVLHSTTKYLNGHSDVLGGAIIVSRPDLAERISYVQNAAGTCASPFDSYLVLRGVKTLAVRMEEHQRSALQIARWLEVKREVEAVFHPGLESHPQHELARRQMSGYGGTFSFLIHGGQAQAFRLLSSVRLFTLAESLGGVQSLIEHPATMTHSSVPSDARHRMGVTENMVRISVGLEDTEDLIADLGSALAHI